MNLEVITSNVIVLAKQAGAYLLSELNLIQDEHIEIKGQGDFVSRADRNAEKMLVEGLKRLVPGSVVMAEEGTSEAEEGDWRWIVDPLDGTANYLQGLPLYAVSIALEDRRSHPDGWGQRVVGVVYLPGINVVYHSFAGGGAWKNGKMIRVRNRRDLKRAMLATAFPFRNRENIDNYLNLFTNLYPKISDFRRIGSAAADMSWVSDGTFDGYFEMDLKPWDLAAGALILEEAGGIVTDWWGNDVLDTCWVVCGNRLSYEAQMKEIQKLNFEPPETKWR